jgi:hypothetical protein
MVVGLLPIRPPFCGRINTSIVRAQRFAALIRYRICTGRRAGGGWSP